MNLKLRLGAYAVLICLTAWFGHRFYTAYSAGEGGENGPVAVKHSPKKKHGTNIPPALAATNAPTGDTNLATLETNVTDLATNAVDQGTNVVAQNPAPDTNQPAAAAAADQDPTTMAETITAKHQGNTMVSLGLFVLAAAGLGLLVAHDVTHMVGGKAGDYLFHDVADGQRDPEYEKAEAVWADGKHLEAIQMLRDYYKRNPRQVHAALRIAEIYEKDLRNFLAAALEYEEVLKQKLPSDRWAWAAIHLCNLYSRIGQQEKTMVLLRRIADEHPRSGAAKKARQRLGLPEPDDVAPAAPESAAGEDDGRETFDAGDGKGEWPTEPGAETPPPAEEPKSNLPPGFRPKK